LVLVQVVVDHTVQVVVQEAFLLELLLCLSALLMLLLLEVAVLGELIVQQKAVMVATQLDLL
jgi:hypothetical protein